VALDKNKAISAAQKFAQKGQFDRAIKEYEAIVRSDPDDVRVWLKIGDLHSRTGKIGEAVSTYRRVADFYEGKGFFLKAVAVYKKVLDVDPTLIEIHRKLGDVYVNLNLTSEALAQYRLVIGSYDRDGREAEGMELLEYMVELVPNEESNHLRLAEAHAKNCNDEKAIEQFAFVLAAMRNQNRHGEFIKIAERLLYLYPSELATGRHLAQAYLATGNTRRALAWLQKLFKSDPLDTRTLALLGDTFHEIGKVDKAVSVYREIARIFGQSGDQKKHRQALEKILEFDANDANAREMLGQLGGPQKAPSTQTRKSTLTATDTNLEIDMSRDERISLCLDDVDLLMKYQLPDHAIQRIDVIFGLDPKNLGACIKLKNVQLAAKQYRAAADALVKAAQITGEQDSAQAQTYLEEALRHAPDHDEAKAMLDQVQANPVQTRTAPPAAPEPEKDDFDDLSINFDIELNLDDLSLDELDDLSGDSSEFELSLEGFELEELGFELSDDELEPAPDDDEFGDLLSMDEPEDGSIGDADDFSDLLEPDEPESMADTAEPKAAPPAQDVPKDASHFGILVPDPIPGHMNTETATADFDGSLNDALLDATIDHSLPEIDQSESGDLTSEQPALDLSAFDDMDLDQAAMDALADIGSDDDDFGGLLVDELTAENIEDLDVTRSPDSNEEDSEDG